MDKTRAISRRQAITSSVIAATAVGLAATEKAIAAESATTTVDVASMTLDELVELRNQVQAEIVARVTADSAELYPGTYEIGKDIAAGNYTLTASGKYGCDTGVFDTQDAVKAIATNDEEAVEAGLISKQYIGAGETGFLSLPENTFLYLTEPCIIAPASLPIQTNQ